MNVLGMWHKVNAENKWISKKKVKKFSTWEVLINKEQKKMK